MTENFKSGFVAVAGKPNVGKSTLINALLGQKIVITSNKPQTTRNRINCILTEEDYQIVFIDTPGIHKPLHKLGEYMVQIAVGSLKGVDILLFLIDAEEGIRESDLHVAKIVKESKIPTVLVINKIDKLIKNRDSKIEEITTKINEICPNIIKTIPISALNKQNLTDLKNTIINKLPEGPMYYPEDMIIDRPSRFIVSELVREKMLLLLKDEVPHSTAVVVEDFKQRDNGIIYTRANIYTERDSQKGIIIGKNGSMIKQIGESARKDIEEVFENKVFLELFVKVKKNWRESDFLIMNTMEFKGEMKKK